MTAGIKTAIAGLRRKIVAALAVAAFAVLFALPARASELAELPDASLCNVILTTVRTAIDQSPHWAAHRTEAARRGLDLAACRAKLGLPKEIPTLLINLDDRTLCEGALDKEREGWEESPVWRQHRDEATRRGLDVPACRVAVGLPPSPEPAIRSATDAWLCSILLNGTRTAVDTLPAGAPARVEAERRKLDLAGCRVALGLPAKVSEAEQRKAEEVALAKVNLEEWRICSAALNASRTGFDNSPAGAPARAEAERRKLDLAGCRVALGLPAKLSEAAQRKAEEVALAKANLDEWRACSAALNAERTAFSNAPQAREARAALEKAGRTALDCRRRLDVRVSPLTAMIVVVESGSKLAMHVLPVTPLRCSALSLRLEMALFRGKPLREKVRADEGVDQLTAQHAAQLANASFIFANVFWQGIEAAQVKDEVQGRVRAVACVSQTEATYSRMDARAGERQFKARIERLSPTDISLKGELGLWQYPELAAEIVASDPPRRLVIDSEGGQITFAMLIAALVEAADVELVVRKGANCHSSCAILAALVNGRAMVSRKADIGIHRIFDFRNGKPTYEGMEESDRLLTEALRNAGVTDAFIERMNNQRTFDRMAPVREKDAITFGLQWRWTD